MVRTSRNEILELYRTVEEKKEQLSNLVSATKMGGYRTAVASIATLGFGGLAAPLYHEEVYGAAGPMAGIALVFAGLGIVAVKDCFSNQRKTTDLENEVNTLVQTPLYKLLLEEHS